MRTKAFPERVERFREVATIYASKDESNGFTVAYHASGTFYTLYLATSHSLSQSSVRNDGAGRSAML